MSTACPNGHESEWADWCSVCGERLGPVVPDPADTDPTPDPAPAAAPAAAPTSAPAPDETGPSCENCGVVRHELDVFCESCGYDFASGSLPEGSDDPNTSTSEAAVEPMHVKIGVDADFFAASVGEVELTLPDPIPDVQVVPLAGVRILIGRTSTSRGIFPEIDVRALTDDPAVSSRHAMLERTPDGVWTLTDLGSTNGTFPTSKAETAIDAGVATPLSPGDAFYLGAWTRIELATSTTT